MAAYYLDTSALVKYYVEETGSKWIIATIDAANTTHDVFLVATVAYAEMCATLGRLTRENILSQLVCDDLVGVALHHFQEGTFQRQAVTWPVAIKAGSLASSNFSQAGYALRGYDAVHLAAALTANQRLLRQQQPPLIFVSADKRLLLIAAESGLQTLNPTEHLEK